jgi:hypothetical protein
LKINLFSPWYSWKIVDLALSNNHSLINKTTSRYYNMFKISNFMFQTVNIQK